MQVCQADGEVIITNDGATILNKMTVTQPAAKMLVELAKSQVIRATHGFAAVSSNSWVSLLQDVVAGDGTTSVTVICGALLKKCLDLLERGVHPTVISDAFNKAADRAVEVCCLSYWCCCSIYKPQHFLFWCDILHDAGAGGHCYSC